jgi:hypothetical protein
MGRYTRRLQCNCADVVVAGPQLHRLGAAMRQAVRSRNSCGSHACFYAYPHIVRRLPRRCLPRQHVLIFTAAPLGGGGYVAVCVRTRVLPPRSCSGNAQQFERHHDERHDVLFRSVRRVDEPDGTQQTGTPGTASLTGRTSTSVSNCHKVARATASEESGEAT